MTDHELLAAFQDHSLPRNLWTHEAHVRMAYLYACGSEAESALEKMRSGIKAYNAAYGVKGGPNTGYHETTTVAFMQLVRNALQQSNQYSNSLEFCRRNAHLLDKRVLLCYYTKDYITQAAARYRFVEPDIRPLAISGLEYPEFGYRHEGVVYGLRPRVYGVITNPAGQIIGLRKAQGWELPGGEQRPGESASAALARGVWKTCRLRLEVEKPIGMADELVQAADESFHFCLRCTFFRASCLSLDDPLPDGVSWLERGRLEELWALQSHCWAVGVDLGKL